jgi:hypothetical protein
LKAKLQADLWRIKKAEVFYKFSAGTRGRILWSRRSSRTRVNKYTGSATPHTNPTRTQTMLIKRDHTHKHIDLDEMKSTILAFLPLVAFRSFPNYGFGLLIWSIIYILNTESWDEDFHSFNFYLDFGFIKLADKVILRADECWNGISNCFCILIRSYYSDNNFPFQFFLRFLQRDQLILSLLELMKGRHKRIKSYLTNGIHNIKLVFHSLLLRIHILFS